jgi:hypothetical protein
MMIQQVDALMYAAKKRGKGRVEHVVVDEEQPPVTVWRGVERRASARVLCHRLARVRPTGEEAEEGLATVCNLSAEGVALTLEQPLPVDTILVIEPLSAGARTLLARVVRVAEHQERWMHGCSLPTRLTAEEMRLWLGRDSHTWQTLPASHEGQPGA